MHPVLLRADGFTLYSYGFMLGLGIFFSWLLGIAEGVERGIPRRTMWIVGGAMVLSGIVGARVYFLLVNYSGAEILENLTRLRHAGRSAYGGFIGGAVPVVAAWAIFGVPFRKYVDAMAPCTMLGLAVTRIGCFLYGCDFGVVSDAAWAVRFPAPSPGWPAGSPAWQHHVALGRIPPTASESLPVIPTQLISSANGFLILAILFLVKWRWRRRFHGALFLLVVVLYGATRALIEQIRDDTQRAWLFDGAVSGSAFIGILSVCIGVPLLVLGARYLGGEVEREAAAPAEAE